ncbi:hypothetical protein GH714_034680 [Hevea brasiliensis]|uniref:MCAfunc domain-containing protein n=1 Tax=Hevea brasiliensis TaxID=3981 RepID=A0A6A6MHM1_HEVBR|nr:hypothetical protein GH714_034680 [Hevea brasiliensis]
MSSWDNLGEIATVAQLTGLDAVRLIGMIAKAANTARMHKKNCRQFAQHLKLIGNLLEQLKISELKRYPETREPLEQLEDALRRSYILVNSCQDRSYLYLLAMGWNIVYQFRKAQNEIDRYLRLVPSLLSSTTLVSGYLWQKESVMEPMIHGSMLGFSDVSCELSADSFKLFCNELFILLERLEDIEKDQREYTFDEEDRKVQDVILKPEPLKDQTTVLKKTLSCSYPKLCFNEALQKENLKLQLELQRSQANLDVSQCEVIQRLIDVTEAAAMNSLPPKSSPLKASKKLEPNYSDFSEKNHSFDESNAKQSGSRTTSRNTSSFSSGDDLLSHRGSYRHEEWHSDLLGCCSEPSLCLKTFFYPCGTFSKIATVATSRHLCINPSWCSIT